mgnify:CR=1 FL=1
MAVAKGENVLSSQAGDATVSHSANLIELIDQALQKAGAKLSDINLFAAAVGPGSFTGLRIGLATVKALASCAGRRCRWRLDARSDCPCVDELPVRSFRCCRQVAAKYSRSGLLVEQGSVAAIDTAAHLESRSVTGEVWQRSSL